MGITHRAVTVDGLELHLAEAGPADGPTVLLLHGFPECWYSWRHQLTALAAEGFHVADAELAADPRATFRRLLSATGGTGPGAALAVAAGGGVVDTCPELKVLPEWLTEADLDVYVAEYADRGFTGGLNWYRNHDRNWALTAAWRDAQVRVPAAYLAGERDLVVAGRDFDAVEATLRQRVPDLRVAELLPGCGHWTQQERPAETSAVIVDFARWTDRT